jgi:hypothetical protein
VATSLVSGGIRAYWNSTKRIHPPQGTCEPAWIRANNIRNHERVVLLDSLECSRASAQSHRRTTLPREEIYHLVGACSIVGSPTIDHSNVHRSARRDRGTLSPRARREYKTPTSRTNQTSASERRRGISFDTGLCDRQQRMGSSVPHPPNHIAFVYRRKESGARTTSV